MILLDNHIPCAAVTRWLITYYLLIITCVCVYSHTQSNTYKIQIIDNILNCFKYIVECKCAVIHKICIFDKNVTRLLAHHLFDISPKKQLYCIGTYTHNIQQTGFRSVYLTYTLYFVEVENDMFIV